jgi:hypothetical protein
LLPVGFGDSSPRIVFTSFWLLGIKVFALVAAEHRHGLHRVSGAMLINFYMFWSP